MSGEWRAYMSRRGGGRVGDWRCSTEPYVRPQRGHTDVVERLLAHADIEARVLLSPGRRLRAEHTMHARMQAALRRMHALVVFV